MSELFDDDEEKDLMENEFVESEEADVDIRLPKVSDARRRLEDLLEEKRLQRDLDDFF